MGLAALVMLCELHASRHMRLGMCITSKVAKKNLFLLKTSIDFSPKNTINYFKIIELYQKYFMVCIQMVYLRQLTFTSRSIGNMCVFYSTLKSICTIYLLLRPCHVSTLTFTHHLILLITIPTCLPPDSTDYSLPPIHLCISTDITHNRTHCNPHPQTLYSSHPNTVLLTPKHCTPHPQTLYSSPQTLYSSPPNTLLLTPNNVLSTPKHCTPHPQTLYSSPPNTVLPTPKHCTSHPQTLYSSPSNTVLLTLKHCTPHPTGNDDGLQKNVLL